MRNIQTLQITMGDTEEITIGVVKRVLGSKKTPNKENKRPRKRGDCEW